MAARKTSRDGASKSDRELSQHRAELAIIKSVQEGLASRLEMQEIYDLVGDKIRDIFDAEAISLYTFDLEKNLMIPRYMIEMGARYKVPPLSIPPLWKEIVRRDQPLMVNTGLAEFAAGIDPEAKPTAGVMPRSAISVPLRMKGGIEGVIVVQNVDHENAFSQSDLDLLIILAASMSSALENAQLFVDTNQRNAELAVINSIQEGLASRLEMQEIYDLVGDKIREIFNDTDLSIIIHDPETNLLHMPYGFEFGKRWTHEPIPLQPFGFIAHVLSTGRTLVINENVAQEMEKYGLEILSGPPKESEAREPYTFKYGDVVISDVHGEKSTLRVPLVMGGQVRGVITLENMEREHAFNDSHVRLLETLANSMSVALENARLWEKEKLFRKALQRELEIGREIQAGFLPTKLPQVEGWEVAASLMSAREVAGDFYDAFELPDGTVGLVIADVCDKGVGAALFMTLFRSLVRAAANLDHYEHIQQESKPHSTRERLLLAMSLTNDYIAETHGESGMFATLFFGILDPRTGVLAYANGGHEPPLILQAGRVRERLTKTGPAVGVLADYKFGIAETKLLPGDVLFAFTDGLPDCKDPKGEFFGQERLHVLLQKDAPAQELIPTIRGELQQYIGGATQFDDITLLSVRRL